MKSIRKNIIEQYKKYSDVEIYSGYAEESRQFPYCALTIVSDVRENDALCISGRRMVDFQIDIYAMTFDEIDAIKSDIAVAFDRPGDVLDFTDFNIFNCRFQSDSDTTELEIDGSEIEYCRCTIEIKLYMEEKENG